MSADGPASRMAVGMAVLNLAQRPLAYKGYGPRPKAKRNRLMRELTNRGRRVLRKEVVAAAGSHRRWSDGVEVDWKALWCGAKLPRSLRGGRRG